MMLFSVQTLHLISSLLRVAMAGTYKRGSFSSTPPPPPRSPIDPPPVMNTSLPIRPLNLPRSGSEVVLVQILVAIHWKSPPVHPPVGPTNASISERAALLLFSAHGRLRKDGSHLFSDELYSFLNLHCLLLILNKIISA